jgi:tetratricopeptide (TPR) repeat protein
LSLRADNDAPNIEALLAAVYVKAGMRDKAEEILKKLKAAGKDVQPRIVAILYAALGNHDEAFTQLEKAFAERVGGLRLIAVEPHYDSLRSDPRFADLLRRMNLPPTISN